MTDADLRAAFPSFTPAQIRAGLTTPAIEGEPPFDWPAHLDEHEASFDADALAVDATRHAMEHLDRLAITQAVYEATARREFSEEGRWPRWRAYSLLFIAAVALWIIFYGVLIVTGVS